MKHAKSTITLLACCCIVLTIIPSASADFVGVTAVIKDDPDTEFLCTQGNGPDVAAQGFAALTVCNVFAAFDYPDDKLINVGNADLQVYNGENPDVFYQHTFGADTPYQCIFLGVFPDLICDSYVSIGNKCDGLGEPAGPDNTKPDPAFDPDEFNFNGHIVGGWLNFTPLTQQGLAGTWPNLQVLILQSSVEQGLSLSGDIDLFWAESYPRGDTVAEIDVLIECAATCGSCPTDTDGDDDTDAADLAVLLGSWGPVDAGICLDADGDGLIGAFDLAVLLGAWGPCPE